MQILKYHVVSPCTCPKGLLKNRSVVVVFVTTILVNITAKTQNFTFSLLSYITYKIALLICGIYTVKHTPRGAGVPPFRLCSSLVHSLPLLLLFITFSVFPFLIYFTYFLLLSIWSLSIRIVPLRFQAWGHRRWPNLGLVMFLFIIVLSVLLS